MKDDEQRTATQPHKNAVRDPPKSEPRQTSENGHSAKTGFG